MPLKDKIAATTAQAFLSHVLAPVGALGEFLTDQDGEFLGEFNVLFVQHSITYNPMGYVRNGLNADRWN